MGKALKSVSRAGETGLAKPPVSTGGSQPSGKKKSNTHLAHGSVFTTSLLRADSRREKKKKKD